MNFPAALCIVATVIYWLWGWVASLLLGGMVLGTAHC